MVSGKNQIIAGNLDVELEYYDGDSWEKVDATTSLFNENSLWEPGHTEVVALRVKNVGTLAFDYSVATQVVEEKAGTNVAGETFLLSNYLDVYQSAVNDTAAIDAMLTDRASAVTGTEIGFNNAVEVTDNQLLPGKESTFALAITMPTTVGNEANYLTGTDAPFVSFGVTVIAKQSVHEEDSFGNDYDENALYPTATYTEVLTGFAKYDTASASYEIDLNNENFDADGKFAKRGSVVVPAAALASADDLSVIVKKLATTDKTVPVGDDENAVTFDVTVEGLKDGNTEEITVTLNVGKGLSGVTVYHRNEALDPAKFSYDSATGNVIFKTTSFSPFTVVYDTVASDPTDTEKPVAIVKDADQFENVAIDWNDDYGLTPANPDQTLAAVYEFTAPHNSATVVDSKYKDWECDYFVKLVSDKVAVLPEGTITLGGNYGDFGWIGFDNPEVNTNEFIPLLGSVTQNAWTYEMVVDFVDTFICGVGATGNNASALEGAKFVVQLRLTNPEDANDIIVCSEIVHNF